MASSIITIKSERELAKMRVACRVVADLLAEIKTWIEPGITTSEIDRRSEEFVRRNGAEPAFKGYRGFPATICASINEEVVHGIPGPRRLKEGDLFTADVGTRYQSYYGDAAHTFAVGKVSRQAVDLMEATRLALEAGIHQMKPGSMLSGISRAIQQTAQARGFSVVRKYVGHGIGANLHEDPQVPNYVSKDLLDNDVTLEAGMVLALEPMLNCGTHEVELLQDGWTVVTADRQLSAHFEDTVAVTRQGHQIMTRP